MDARFKKGGLPSDWSKRYFTNSPAAARIAYELGAARLSSHVSLDGIWEKDAPSRYRSPGGSLAWFDTHSNQWVLWRLIATTPRVTGDVLVGCIRRNVWDVSQTDIDGMAALKPPQLDGWRPGGYNRWETTIDGQCYMVMFDWHRSGFHVYRMVTMPAESTLLDLSQAVGEGE